jgi:hypothetical protein
MKNEESKKRVSVRDIIGLLASILPFVGLVISYMGYLLSRDEKWLVWTVLFAVYHLWNKIDNLEKKSGRIVNINLNTIKEKKWTKN